MARVNTYLNFPNHTEEAFSFYKSVFGGEFIGGISRFGDIPQTDSGPAIPDEVRNQVMHVALPILGGHVLMGTDAPEAMGFQVNFGNNVYINLQPDTRQETRRLFYSLSEGGKIETDLQDMFWGDYYGTCTDKYGVRWMLACSEKAGEKS